MKLMLLMCLEMYTTKLTSPEEEKKEEEKTTLGVYIYLIHNPMLSCSYVPPFGYYWLLNKEINKQTNKEFGTLAMMTVLNQILLKTHNTLVKKNLPVSVQSDRFVN